MTRWQTVRGRRPLPSACVEQAIFAYLSRLAEGTEPIINEFLLDGTLEEEHFASNLSRGQIQSKCDKIEIVVILHQPIPALL